MTNHPTADLARFCAQLHYQDLSTTVRERVRYLLLDHLAVTLRGSTLPSSLAGNQMLESMAIGSSHGVTIFGRQERAQAEWASLVNGIAAHGLEMDDVENRSSLHPGVVVFPAVLALGDPHDPLSWEQLEARFHDLVAPVIVEERKRIEISERVKGLDKLEQISL
jgi:2-methylcitrate dehydratase PrpD